jgi:hypothetical protein
MYINVEVLPSPRLARVTFTCVCVCNTYVCVYIYVRRERALFFFDEREELNSTKILPLYGYNRAICESEAHYERVPHLKRVLLRRED